MSFFERALTTVQHGVPVIRLRPKTKIAFDADWPSLATTDPNILQKWNLETPEANCAAVAQNQLGRYWFWEIDSPEVIHRIKNEIGQKIPRTYRVRSSPEHGHFYWLQTPASLELGNIAQGYVKNQDWSARVDSQYVVAANSIHPSGAIYTVVTDAPIIECPQWLIDWLRNQKIEKAQARAVFSNQFTEPIPSGGRNSTLASIAGRARQVMGMDADELFDYLLSVNQKRCEPPLSEDEVRTIANSIARYAVTDNSIPMIYHGPVPQQAQQSAPNAPLSEPEIDNSDAIVRPTFPDWVMLGTSIYENLVKPAIQSSDKYPELIFMPAVQMYLNILAMRVQSKSQRGHIPNLFLGVIAPYGHFFKSSSCELAQKFFTMMGFAADYEGRSKAGERVMIVSAGSPEGLGLRMRDCDGKHALLYFDELGTCVSKAGIEHSSYVDQLCTMYEARKFENEIKARKDSFSFPAGQYCFSWCWCTTDRKFPGLWMSLANEDSGLNDRMFFLLAPEEARETHLYTEPDLVESAPLTQKLIDRAIEKKEFDYEDREDAQQKIKGIDPRSQALFQDLALYFAVDLGLDNIDADCCERARVLVEYRNQTQAFLDPVQADTRQGKLQIEIVRMLKMHQGKMPLSSLKKEMHAERKGTRMWNDAINGLIGEGTIEFRAAISGKGIKPEEQRPAMVYLVNKQN